jgi:diguanylate cyclase (GGDEF)-like protein
MSRPGTLGNALGAGSSADAGRPELDRYFRVGAYWHRQAFTGPVMSDRPLSGPPAPGVPDPTEPAGAAPNVQRTLARAFGGVGLLAVVAVGVVAVFPSLLVLLALVGVGAGACALVVAASSRVVATVATLEDDLLKAREAYLRASLDARLDPLTGLGNHRAFQEELARQVAQAARDGRTLALAILDLDDLKRLNDAEGHAAGDGLLEAVGRLIRATLRAADRAFRIGGDEFALLLPATDAETAYTVVRRLLSSATGGHPVLRGTPRFSFSAGISTCPSPSADGIRLTRHADAALYWAKRHGRTDIQVFDPGRHGTAGDERSTEELAVAVSRVAAERALRAVYQPIVSLSTGRPIGFEGLVRPLAGTGFANAGSLFTAAEVADRIVELDMAAIEVITSRVGRLEAGQYLGLNLSPRTLETEQFHVGEIVGILRRSGLDARQVVIELTEREAIEDLVRLRSNLERVRAAGFRVAADDVGAGNAGLRLLSEIAFDVVKVDLSLVQKGVLQESSLAVLRGLREMARRSGATVVAEGVETPEQLVALRGLGIPAAQGYLLGRPGERPVAEPVDLDLLASMSDLDEASIAS